MAALALPSFGQITTLTENEFEPRWKHRVATSAALTKPKEVTFIVPSEGSAYRIVIATEEIPGWVQPTIAAFIGIQKLSDNWDSYGGKRVSFDLIRQALSILGSIMEVNSPIPSVVPLGDGGMQLEWHRKQQDLEIVLAADDVPQFYYQNRTAGIELEGFASDTTGLAQLLRKIA